ncbi:hypothetical protein PQC13_gp040 [Synechococcus phage S-SRM01]|uniref:Uncharacterized protein n=1 Tax=Synechococcus phage S-SRM01 TaxID=2781608 RepID=A0A879R3X0_9CAUD|nr:hypothetical protein PQC13_gp040 [Synechococcus phage S-SRM01]QPX48005.1 hypothetical protein [Synechococcus phage S-SRM01]
MAELDPEKVGRLGVDPGTGSPLSQEVRNALLKKSTIDASVFQNIENRRTQTDAQNAELSRGQEQALLGFNSTLQAIRTDIVKLGTGLSGIALLLQQDAAEDQNKIRAEQEKQRLLAERQVRIGKESDIEQKIQNAVAEPVQKLVPKVDDIFGKIGAALGILFGGWLTNQTVQAIQASEEGNTKLFNDIRFNILKNIGIAVGGLFAIRAGFSLITRTIGSIASGLTKLFIAKPLAIAAALLPRPGGGPKPGGPKPSGPKPSGGGFLGLLGNIINGVTGVMNFLNGENVDAALAALTFVPGGGVFKLARVAAGTVYTLDQIAEALDKNFTGADPKLLAQKKKELEEAKKKEKPLTSTKPAPATLPAAPPAAQPQTPMMGEQTPSTPAPSPDMEKKFEQAWQYRNNPMARGRIEDAWSKMTPDQQQQAKTWAQTKGYDWNEMKLKDAVDMSDLKQQPSKTETAEISPAQVSMPLKEPQQVGQLPEPKPSLTMIKTSNNQSQQVIPPLTNEPLTDVPLINSANPDNFYVLYSQLNYNVVM